jgi:hypothetical protein
MRKIGIIDWYGGYNSKLERENDFGYAKLPGEERGTVKIYESDVVCDVDDLNGGVFVTFELTINKNGKHKAKKVNLLSDDTNIDNFDHQTLAELPSNWRARVFGVLFHKQISQDHFNRLISFISSDTHLTDQLLQNVPFYYSLKCADLSFERLSKDDQMKYVALHWYQDLSLLNETTIEELLKLTDWQSESREKAIEIIQTLQNAKFMNTLDRDEAQKMIADYFQNRSPYNSRDCYLVLPLQFRYELKLLEYCTPTEAAVLAEQLYNHFHNKIFENDYLQNLLHSILQKIKSFSDVWERLPESLLAHESIISVVPIKKRAYLITKFYSTKEITASEPILNELYQTITGLSQTNTNFLSEWLQTIDTEVISIPKIFDALPVKCQVEEVWSQIFTRNNNVQQSLQRLTPFAFIRLLMKISQTQTILPNLQQLYEIENHRLIKGMLLIMLVREQGETEKKDAFDKIHDHFCDYIIQVYESNEEVDWAILKSVFPQCHIMNSNVSLCEAKTWKIENEITAFCPRIQTRCTTCCGEKNPLGAQISARENMDWEHWNLLEYMQSERIEPYLTDELNNQLENVGEYINRMAGWINRIIQLRDRLRCSKCKTRLIGNLKYSRKKMSVYANTVFYCPHSKHSDGHDQSVYINHCWNDGSIVDNRYEQIRIEGYYLCMNCGTGPQQSYEYTQGDICPACGSHEMVQSNRYYRHFTCRNCQHKIQIPGARNLTGPRSHERTYRRENGLT